LAKGEPAISVDTKKKELVGDFKNGGANCAARAIPSPCASMTSASPNSARRCPTASTTPPPIPAGSISASITIPLAFAVESIRRWWHALGQTRYPAATCLLLTADCGGSNGPRLRLWKTELQKLANETGLAITVAHLPPGTSKWNRIEHRLFAYITQNWRGKPLVTLAAIVQLIAATTTRTGLAVHCTLDANSYPNGIAVSDAELATVNITPAAFHGEWNYTIKPNT
jgi:Rhodopirellula transposase DDE domain